MTPSLDLTTPLSPGDKLSAYHVAESSPTRLVLKTSVVMFLTGIVLSLLAISFFGCLLWPAHNPAPTVSTPFPTGEFTGLIVSIIVLIVCVGYLGQTLEFDSSRATIRRTRVFVFNDELQATSLLVDIRNQKRVEDKASKQSSAPKPAGRDEAVLTLRKADGSELFEIARGTLGTGEWPSVARGAIQIGKILKLPISVQGKVEYADAAAAAILAQFAAAIGPK